jgi:uncharacterized protein (TIGR03000 family)
MNLHRLPNFVYAALAVAALAFASGPAWAQKGGGHGGGHGGEHGGGHGGGEWRGGGWGGGSWGGYGYSPYGGYGRGWYGGYPYSYGRYPGYYSGGYYDSYPYGYDYVPESAPLANAPAPRMNIPDNAALIDVRVPGNAEVLIDEQKTNQTGTMREFVTPALDPGQEFSYDIRARWTENGQEVVRHRKVNFHAGDRLTVNLMAPEPRPTAEATQ